MNQPALSTVHVGDALEILRSWPDECIDCIVTSPPYWGLRDYKTEPQVWGGDPDCEHAWQALSYQRRGNDDNKGGKQATNIGANQRDVPVNHAFCSRCGAWLGNYGLEPTIELYVEHTVAIFRELRRVLKPSGTCWLNIGDSYASGQGKCINPGGSDLSLGRKRVDEGAHPLHRGNKSTLATQGLKPKDLCFIPMQVARALQADGWWVWSDIIWEKENPMPESCQHRPASSYEHILLMGKSGKKLVWRHRDTRAWAWKKPEPDYRWRNRKTGEEQDYPPPPEQAKLFSRINLWRGMDAWYDGDAIQEPVVKGDAGSSFFEGKTAERQLGRASKNRKIKAPSGWDSDPGAHGSFHRQGRGKGNRKIFHGGGAYTGGNSFDNSAAKPNEVPGNEPNPTGMRNSRNVWRFATQPYPKAHFATFPEGLPRRCILAGCPPGGVVLDPFMGSGTTGLVAEQLDRQWVGIELNPEYAEMARRRTAQQGLFSKEQKS